MRRAAVRRFAPVIACAVTALAWAAAEPASGCDSASCSLLTRGENTLLPKKRLRLDLSFGYANQGSLLRGSQDADVVLRPRVFLERERIIPGFHQDIDGYDRVLQMDATYGLGTRLNLIASVPLAIWHAHDVAHFGLRQEYGTIGLGDALLGARWALGPPRLVAGFSVKLPTGAHEIGGEFGGGIQDPALQPGTGAFDLVGSLLYTWRAEALGLSCSAAGSYQWTTANGLDYRFGNQTVVTLGVARSVAGRLSASLQAKLFHQDRNEYLGEGVPSTGSTVVYVTPGLRLSGPHNVSFYGFVLFAPYRYVNEAQLGPRIAVLTGLSKLF